MPRDIHFEEAYHNTAGAFNGNRLGRSDSSMQCVRAAKALPIFTDQYVRADIEQPLAGRNLI
jgi:hypothetical protein